MDDPVAFAGFIQHVCGVTDERARREILSFLPTFHSLMSTTDDEIDKFVTAVHGANTGRANAQRISIPVAVIMHMKALRFELDDRNKCNALPDADILAGITVPQLIIMRNTRNQDAREAERLKETSLPTLTVPKFTTSNFEGFMDNFKSAVARVDGIHGVPIDYLLRDTNGDYNHIWSSRREKLKNCLALTGQQFKHDSELLYQLYIQYVGTEGHGSNIVRKYARTKNGYKLHQDFCGHYKNKAYLSNKATEAEQKLKHLVYKGDRTRFNMEEYYKRLTEAFSDLEHAGASHELNEHQKVSKFENGLQNAAAIRYHIEAKNEWERLPLMDQTFDTFYNLFSANFTKYKSLTNGTADDYTRSRRINAINTSNPGRGRGRGGRGRGRGKGHGRGRGGRGTPHSPYNSTFINSKLEARQYPKDEFRNLSPQQKAKIQQLKIDAGWINGYTPPPGFELNSDGYAIPSASIVSAVHAAASLSSPGLISNTETSSAKVSSLPPRQIGMFHLPPPPTDMPPVPNIVDASHAGMAFGPIAARCKATSMIKKVTDCLDSYTNCLALFNQLVGPSIILSYICKLNQQCVSMR